MKAILISGVWAALLSAGAAADTFTLEMPAPASVIGGRAEAPGSYALPIGPFAAGKVPERLVEGALDQRAYRLDSGELTTMQVLVALRDQLSRAGYAVVYDCDTEDCGGFDFRYGMDVLPEPQMHVDLGDFRYLAAERKAAAGSDFVGVLVSRSADQGFVQVTSVTAGEPVAAVPVADAPVAQVVADAPPDGADAAGQGSAADPVSPEQPVMEVPPVPAGGLGDRLEQAGSAALDDLVFASGKAVLEDKDYASLAELAEWLKAHPDRRVTLVGHTDASGSLSGNITLSKVRATSVRAWLVDHYGVPAGQIDAQGAGYLAPRDSNLTEAGRTRNRRVEVMLTSTE